MKNFKKYIVPIFFLLIAILAIITLTTDVLFARPGGGHSYSGGGGGGYSGGGGSGGGGGGDGLFTLIFWILFDVLPAEISIPLVIIFVIYSIIKNNRMKKDGKHVSSSFNASELLAKAFVNADSQIATLKERDANFSKYVFLDFVNSLYHRYYSYQGSKDFKLLNPFLSNTEKFVVENSLNPNLRYNEIVIGSMTISEIIFTNEITGIVVDIDANYTASVAGKNTRYVVTERWLFNRKAGVLSKEPKDMQNLSCPNCGAPADFTDAGECNYCHTFLEAGEQQWMLKKRKVMSSQSFRTNNLTTYSEEVGTNYPTVFSRDLNSNIGKFMKNHSVIEWEDYWRGFENNIVRPYFLAIYAAWSERRWSSIRNVISDRLYESYSFWIDAYNREGLINKLDGIQISKVQLVDLDVDKYYDSLTVRIYASCYDYVSDAAGTVKGGSKRNRRSYSEYWTFIRKSGVNKPEEEFDLKNCPNCGAPADKMGQAAVCGYCNAKISNGDFSWVLAVITQDEVYK